MKGAPIQALSPARARWTSKTPSISTIRQKDEQRERQSRNGPGGWTPQLHCTPSDGPQLLRVDYPRSGGRLYRATIGRTTAGSIASRPRAIAFSVCAMPRASFRPAFPLAFLAGSAAHQNSNRQTTAVALVLMPHPPSALCTDRNLSSPQVEGGSSSWGVFLKRPCFLNSVRALRVFARRQRSQTPRPGRRLLSTYARAGGGERIYLHQCFLTLLIADGQSLPHPLPFLRLDWSTLSPRMTALKSKLTAN